MRIAHPCIVVSHLLVTTSMLGSTASARADPLAGFRPGPRFGEQVRERWLDGNVRVIVNIPARIDSKRPTRLVIYATPNGNTIEQTLGCAKTDGLDWHFDIQHVVAQVRRLREVSPGENIVLACIEAEGLSWPAWRRNVADSSSRIRSIVEGLRDLVPGTSVRVDLTGHSGGGSFVFGFLNSVDSIPDYVERIAFLDSNYAYADAEKHGDKLLAWLKADADRRLSVIAYDDREIMLDGKRVVSKDGGTYRATQRMIERLVKDVELTEGKLGDFVTRAGLDGRVFVYVHTNPKNQILHTALVGEMNGLLRVLTDGDPKAPEWGAFGGPRAYAKWIEPAPGIPPRPADTPNGSAFVKQIAALKPTEREEVIAKEVLRGNIPDFLRKFQTITATIKDKAGRERTANYEVIPDYLAIGSDADFVRMPMTPMTAQRIADAFGCSLPTRKVVDDVHRNASVKLEPIPLSEAREATDTFARHNELIEKQRTTKVLGAIVAGIKKDVVITNRLGERPNRVAIYGWHKLDGTPIQPLTVVHRDTYVDYSHGVRLMKRMVMIDGKPSDVRHVLHSADLSGLLSDEGPVNWPTY